MFCLLRLLAAARLPAERVLIYAWNPLPVWAFAGNGHVDAAAIGLLAAALLLRVRHRDGWAGAALGLAILVEVPACSGGAGAVAPTGRLAHGWPPRSATIVAAVRCSTAASACAFSAFCDGYGSEEGYDTGEGFWLLAGLVPVDAAAGRRRCCFTRPRSLSVLVGFAAWFAFVRRPDDPVAICAAAGI